MKTSELTGSALDWAVAKCENHRIDIHKSKHYTELRSLDLTQVRDDDWTMWEPSTDWKQGGPIIEREKIALRENADSPDWYACKRWDSHGSFGRTPLIAAMRCYVASKLGDEVEIPKELA